MESNADAIFEFYTHHVKAVYYCSVAVVYLKLFLMAGC